MDKQKEIEEMAKKICKSSSVGCNFPTCNKCGIKDTCKARIYATRAIKAGYGNVRQAVKEFAEKLKNECAYPTTACPSYVYVDSIDELLEEYLNVDQT